MRDHNKKLSSGKKREEANSPPPANSALRHELYFLTVESFCLFCPFFFLYIYVDARWIQACVLVTIYRRESDLFALLLRERHDHPDATRGALTVLCDMTLDDGVHLEPQKAPLVVKVVNTCELVFDRGLCVSVSVPLPCGCHIDIDSLFLSWF